MRSGEVRAVRNGGCRRLTLSCVLDNSVTDLISRGYNGVNGEWACDWQSSQRYDDVQLKVATSSTVAERVRVELDENQRRLAFNSKENMTIDDKEERRKLSKRLCEKMARLLESNLTRKTCSPEVETLINRQTGHVRRIIEKYSNLSRTLSDELSNRTLLEKSLVDYKISTTPGPNFVEKIYVEPRTQHNRPATLEKETKSIADRGQTYNDDLSNGNVIATTRHDKNISDDENGNNWSDPHQRKQQFTRQDSIAEVIQGMNGNITPSNVIMNILPVTDPTMKYNLDSTKMRLMYSITPITDVTYDWGWEIHEAAEDRSSSCLENLGSPSVKSQSSSILDEVSEFIWQSFAPSTNSDDTASVNRNVTVSTLDSSLETDDEYIYDNDRSSNDGSDILELPISTVLELNETSDASFSKDISITADEIIAQLDDRENCLSPENIERFAKPVIGDDEKITPFGTANEEISEQQSGDVCRPGHEPSTRYYFDSPLMASNHIDIDNHDSENVEAQRNDVSIETRDGDNNSVIVIDEIVHHVIDKCCGDGSTIDERDIFYSKRVKESTNIGIVKEMQTSLEDNNNTLDSPVILEFCSLARSNRDDSELELNLIIESDEKNARSKVDTDLIENEDDNFCEYNSNDSSSQSNNKVGFSPESTDNDIESADEMKDDHREYSQVSSESSLLRQSYGNDDESINDYIIEYIGPKIHRRSNDYETRDEIIGTFTRNHLTCITEEEIADELLEKSDEKLGSHVEERDSNATYTISDFSDDEKQEDCTNILNMDESRETALPDRDPIDHTRLEVSEHFRDRSYQSFNEDVNSHEGVELSTLLLEKRVKGAQEKGDVENLCADHTAYNQTEGKTIDSMASSYDTNEFVLLERQLSQDHGMFDAADGKGVTFYFSSALDTSPLKGPPRYEDTSLYRVVSKISLTDTMISSEQASTDLQSD